MVATRSNPALIDRVQDRYGQTIYRADGRVCETCQMDQWDEQGEPILPDLREQVIDQRTAFQMVSILEGVVQRGTGARVRAVGKPLGGKTGTTNEERDAWFVGFAPDLALGIYIGYDTPKPMGKKGSGGGVAAPIFRDFMQSAIGDKPGIPFRTAPGIRLVRVDPKSGRPARSGGPYIMEAFKAGTEPTADEGDDMCLTVHRQMAWSWGRSILSTILSPAFSPKTTPTIDSGTGGLY